MRFQNDNFLGCCGTNTTLNTGEETYCHDCDTYAQVVGEEVTWDNGTATRLDWRGMLTEDVAFAKDTLKEVAAKVGYTAAAITMAIAFAVIFAAPWLAK